MKLKSQEDQAQRVQRRQKEDHVRTSCTSWRHEQHTHVIYFLVSAWCLATLSAISFLLSSTAVSLLLLILLQPDGDIVTRVM